MLILPIRTRIVIAALLCPALFCSCSSPAEDPSRFNLDSGARPDDAAADQGVRDPDARPSDDTTPLADANGAVDTTSEDVVEQDTSAPPTDTPRDSEPNDTDPATDVPVRLDGEITVATWNVRRLFDTNCDSGFCGENDFESAYSDPQFNFRINQVVAGIDALDADIVLLQEIETQTSLDALAVALGARYGVQVLGETDFDASLDVAIIGRGTLRNVTTHRRTRIPLPSGGTTTFAREFLELEFDIDGNPVIVFNAHFKSQNDDDPARRLAEGRAAASILSERIDERPDALIILGGDLNDEPGSPALDAIEESGELLRVASELGEGAGTVTFNGRANALDHLFVCRTSCSGSYIAGSAAVVRSSGSQALSGSDHAGLRARFRLD